MTSTRQIQNIAEGLLILARYDTSGYSVCAEHDQLWAGPDEAAAVSPEDGAALVDRGWHVDNDVDRWSFNV